MYIISLEVSSNLLYHCGQKLSLQKPTFDHNGRVGSKNTITTF